MSCGNLNAGELRERVLIMTYSAGKDAIGAPVNDFSTLGYVQAKVEYKTATEPKRVTRETSLTKTIFTIRQRTDLDKKMIVVHKDQAYNILTILKVPQPRNQFLKVVAERTDDYDTYLNQLIAPDGQFIAGPDGRWIMGF